MISTDIADRINSSAKAFVGISALLVATSAVASAQGYDAKTTDPRMRSTVMVYAGAENAAQSLMGTGTIVAKTEDSVTVLTACHVVSEETNAQSLGNERFHIRLYDGRELSVSDIPKCADHADIAIFKAGGQNVDGVDVATFTPVADIHSDEDQNLTIIGNPSSPYVETTAQHPLPYRSTDNFQYDKASGEGFAALCGGCMDGDSGAAVWDAKGNAIGVLTESATITSTGQRVLIAEPASNAIALMQKAGPAYGIAQAAPASPKSIAKSMPLKP